MLFSQMLIHSIDISFVSFDDEFHFFLLFFLFCGNAIIGRLEIPVIANFEIFGALKPNVIAPKDGVYFNLCFPRFVPLNDVPPRFRLK